MPFNQTGKINLVIVATIHENDTISKLKQLLTLTFLLILIAGLLRAQFAIDVFDKYTSVSQLGLTVTNYGVLGNGWNKVYGEILPSCMYRQHTEILREQVEHFSFAGLWIGGIVNGHRRVSTAIVDGVFESGEEGFEFFATSDIDIRSSISSTSVDPMSQYFSLEAVSHQDMLMDFRDYGREMPEHTPLGIDVHLETYAWNFTFADAFVILNYTITNFSTDTIKDIYAGIWVDASIANMNYTSTYEPGGGFSWYDNLDGFDESVDDAGFSRDIAYQYDADGDDGWAESYIGISMLGGNVPFKFLDSYYHQWVWSNASNTEYPAYSYPMNDIQRYEAMTSSVPLGADPTFYNSDGYPNEPNSWLFMLSAGPYGSQPILADSSSWALPPGETCQVVLAVVAARWNGSGDDSAIRRENLYINADWAQQAYDGEDKNRNNILDEGEDTDHNGVLDRYILPEPPPNPNMVVKAGNQTATVYWSNEAEKFLDPVSQKVDFEGYRIYGARKTAVSGDNISEFSLLGDYDVYIDTVQNIGYNTGLDAIQIKNELGEPDTITIDGRDYYYKFENIGINNGWLNYYSVTAYDRGDPEANLASLESSVYANRTYVYPGIVPEADSSWVGDPSVYPNPYRGQAQWDGYGSRERMIWFQNLPREAKIRIFTLAGDLVDVIQHNETYRGEDVGNIDNRKEPLMSGGEHAWDLITRYDQAVASGLYLFTVENLDTKEVKEGKFLIIK